LRAIVRLAAPADDPGPGTVSKPSRLPVDGIGNGMELPMGAS
jgi:hypothetical protein